MAIFSSIDIGTNSTRLLIAEQGTDKSLHPLVMEERITQLGKGLKQKGFLAPESLDRVSSVLKEYMDIVTFYKGGRPLVFATSAAREAKNKESLVKIVQDITDGPCKIISGQEEALLNFIGVKSDLPRQNQNVVISDVGGGSTELIFVKNGSIVRKESLKIGSRRLTEKFFHHDPVTAEEVTNFISYTETVVNRDCPSVIKYAEACIMVGGTATTLAMIDISTAVFNYEEVHLHELSLNTVSELVKIFSMKSVHDRKVMAGLHPQRADVILAGALIIEVILKHLCLSSCLISVRDLLFGMLVNGLTEKILKF